MSSTGSVVAPVLIVPVVLTNVVAIPLSTFGSLKIVYTVAPLVCAAAAVPY